MNAFFETDFGPGDLAGAYAGVRPLISTGDPKKSVDISRKAELYETSSGMITITGGKLTTWRRMAKMVVDRMVERECREAPCRTHEIPLGHAVDPRELRTVAASSPRSRCDHLAGRYGHVRRATCSSSAASGRSWRAPIVDGMPDLLAEALVAARFEQARTRRRRPAAPHAPRPARGPAAASQDEDAVRARRRGDGAELGWDAPPRAARGGAVARGGRGGGARDGRAGGRVLSLAPPDLPCRGDA